MLDVIAPVRPSLTREACGSGTLVVGLERGRVRVAAEDAGGNVLYAVLLTAVGRPGEADPDELAYAVDAATAALSGGDSR